MVEKKRTDDLGNEEKEELIDFRGSGITIKRKFKIINISRSTLYRRRKRLPPSQREIDIKDPIELIHSKNRNTLQEE